MSPNYIKMENFAVDFKKFPYIRICDIMESISKK